MSVSDKPYLTVLCLFAGLAFFPLAHPSSFRLDEARSAAFESFPMTLDSWIGKEMPVDQRTYEILETKNLVSRLYQNKQGDKIQLLLVGSRKDRRVAHPPEVCYLSSNYAILSQGESRIRIQETEIPIKEFVARNEKDPRVEQQVLYLYKIGGRFTTNYYDQQLQFALDRLAKRDSEVLLIELAGADRSKFAEFLELVLLNL